MYRWKGFRGEAPARCEAPALGPDLRNPLATDLIQPGITGELAPGIPAMVARVCAGRMPRHSGLPGADSKP